MANLILTMFFFFFSCNYFMNEKVEAFDAILSLANNFQNILGPVNSTAPLPVKYPLPTLGTTACSTYPHADKGIENFQQPCYTQLYVQPSATYPFRCRTTKFTAGLPLANISFQIPEVTGSTPQAGYAFADAVSTTNSSQHLTYNLTFVETQTAELVMVFTDAANLSKVVTIVISSYTDKGYVYITCTSSNLTVPLCSPLQYAFVCTYQRNPPQADIDALAVPLYQYPFYFGKNMQVLNQTGC